MGKYMFITYTAIQEFLAYRLNFILWRLRNVLNLLLIYFLWTNVFDLQNSLFGYTKIEIVSYILLTNVLGALVFSTRTNEVSDQILSGNIMNVLLKPFHYFGYVSARELADKILNVSFSIGEIVIIIILFQPTIVLQHDLRTYAAVLFFLINGVCISFFISFLLSLIAFWSTDVWGPKFIYFVLTSLLAGIMFPLDVLPSPLYDVIMLTPFPYMVYVPSKLAVLGNTMHISSLFLMSCVWIVILFFCTHIVWNKGMKEFSFFGK